MTLYEIAEDYKELQYKIEKEEIPEEAIEDTLESLEGEFKYKADNITCMIKNLEGEANLIKKEAENQLKRAESKKRKAERLKEYLYSQMLLTNASKVETPRNCILIRRNPTKLDIAPEFVEWAQKYNESLLKFKCHFQTKLPLKQRYRLEMIFHM